MEKEITAPKVPKRTRWAIASLILCVAGCILLGLASAIASAFFYSLLCWALSLGSGIVALLVIRMRRPAYTGKLQAIIGVCLSGAAIFWFGWCFLIGLALRGEPFDESDPASVMAKIEKNWGFRFPDKMESLKAADRIAGGVPPRAYVFIIRFTTDRDGLAQLRQSLSQLEHYDEELHYADYDPRNIAFSTGTPQWFKTKIEKGIIYKGSGGLLTVVCVESEGPEKIEVYMEGEGDSSLKKED